MKGFETERPERTAPDFGMGKGEKLRHRTLVEGVFGGGKTLYAYPLRLTYRILSRPELEDSFRNGVPPRVGRLQMLVTVPKKKLRHAVDRVLMRRRIREAYRLNRLPLLQEILADGTRYVELAFIYLHKEETDYATVEKKMKRLLSKIERELLENGETSEGAAAGEG